MEISDRRALAELLRPLSFGGVIGEAEGKTGLCRNHCRDSEITEEERYGCTNDHYSARAIGWLRSKSPDLHWTGSLRLAAIVNQTRAVGSRLGITGLSVINAHFKIVANVVRGDALGVSARIALIAEFRV